MDRKASIRKKFFSLRKKNYFEINEKFFNPLIKLIKNRNKRTSKKIYLSLYYPSSNEVNVLKLINLEYSKKFNFLLPVIEKNKLMNFFKWKKNDILFLNKFGIPEPIKTNKIVPDFILVPLLAFDKYKNRIGYGKGFYDKYLRKHIQINKNIVTIGVAFSFQKYHKLPIDINDYKLDYIITEKGIIK